jgi:type IV pilus assembly protein PilW
MISEVRPDQMLIALALGLIIVLGVVQTFLAAKNTYVSQNTAAAMQEDARFVLSKMIQELRMVGMFGCLGTITDASSAGISTRHRLRRSTGTTATSS